MSSEMTSFLRFCQTVHGSFLSVCQWGCLALLYYFCLRGQPDTKHLAEIQEGWKIGSARIRSFIALLAKFSLLNCMHTRHSDVFFRTTGWMQIGCDSSRAMIFGATHEWRCSTTHSKSSILLFISTVLSLCPYSYSSLALQSLSTISKESSVLQRVTSIFPRLYFLHSILKDGLGRNFIWLNSNPREGYRVMDALQKKPIPFL